MRGVTLLLVVLATGCSADATPTPAAGTAYSSSGVFGPYQAGAVAVSYDQTLVPAGATAKIVVAQTASATEIRLVVTGLRPSRAYGAHLHTNPCGPEAAAAGPHYQHQRDPAASASSPSVNPSFANARNEVWLDFTTDAGGDATSVATQQWTFDQASRPRSLVIHAETTKTAAGHAGDAGPRVACMTLPS